LVEYYQLKFVCQNIAPFATGAQWWSLFAVERLNELKMAKRNRTASETKLQNYNAQIGELFLLVNSSNNEMQCRTLAITDWNEIDPTDTVSLLAPLSLHPSAEVRQLVALQLASMSNPTRDPRAIQALVTLAADGDIKVRVAAARSSYIAKEFGLTGDNQFGKSLAERLVHWEQVDETTMLSFQCPDLSVARQALAILAGIAAKQMIQRSDEKQAQPQPKPGADVPAYLPDLIVDEVQPESFDLPRQGVPKDVLNISKASIRLPELLTDN
jgi:hypothetical protein